MSCGCTNGTCGCGCCTGIEARTPRPIWNAPGLAALDWRAGTHADILDSLLSRLSQVPVDVETDEIGAHGRLRMRRLYPLRDLRTRATDDPTIALLDAWSVVGDVLTFYTERIANEGYLRTATELGSIIELARLVGYKRRPGVAASVYLAFTVDDTWKDSKPLIVPAGARVQSMPEPDVMPALFETSDPLAARPEWNLLVPRQLRPTYLPFKLADRLETIYFEGTATNLVPGNALLFVYGEDDDDDDGLQVMHRAAKVTADFDRGWTKVDMMGAKERKRATQVPVDLGAVITQLERRPSIPPASAARLALTLPQTFGAGSAAVDSLLSTFHPFAAKSIFRARANADVTTESELLSVLAFRVKAGVYANMAPPRMKTLENGSVEVLGDWKIVDAGTALDRPTVLKALRPRVLDLDSTYESILPNTWVAIERPTPRGDAELLITKVVEVQTVNRTDYLFPAKITRLLLRDKWLKDSDDMLGDVRAVTVHAAPDALALANEPVESPLCGAEIELDRQVDGLQPGRWIIISGERTAARDPSNPHADDLLVEGITATELAMIAGVRQDTLYVNGDKVVSTPPATNPKGLPRDRTHTFLQLATPLAYCYKRATAVINGNVAHATHGETHAEPLGSGDPRQTFQTFTLKSAPLTYVSAPTPSGVASSLAAYVNDVRWREADNLLDLAPTDRGYLTESTKDDRTRVLFGDGRNGSRLPAGTENVRAIYRSGIGASGNVRAAQITQLVAHTSGLRSVTNPQDSTGGADPEGAASTRARAPLAVAALDRLVATVDYGDFARLFGGIAKASAVRLAGRRGQVVHVTIAGERDTPIEPTSDVHRNLVEALELYGDPYLPLQVSARELRLLVIAARIRIDGDRLWDDVRPRVEAALWDHFGFEARQLGQDAYAAEAMAVMRGVAGVDYVDLDLFTAVSEKTPFAVLPNLAATLAADGAVDRVRALPDRLDPHSRQPLPAQLVILSRLAPTLLMLSEVPHA